MSPAVGIEPRALIESLARMRAGGGGEMVPRGTVIAIVVVLLGVIVFDVSGPAWIVNYPGPTALVTGGAMTLLAAVLTGTRGPKPPEPDERPPWSAPTTIEPESPPPRRHAREDS